MGLGVGYLIALCYIIFSAAVTGRDELLRLDDDRRHDRDRPPGLGLHDLGLALVSLFAWFHIELTAKILGVALICEVLALVVLAVGIIAAGGAGRLQAAPLNPANIFDN